MQIHYLIVAIIVVLIIIWQINTYFKNRERINRLRTMFPSGSDLILQINEITGITSIRSSVSTEDFAETLDDINAYLEKNRNKTSDYHILKEIVNRNAENVEEEVDTMLSAPLYLGLMATIAGVAIGVISFAWSDLKPLFTGQSLDPIGIKTLLTDVGIAMTASFLGVLFTKISTSEYKGARAVMSQNKNKFLTWIQTELMPNLTDNLTGALIKMTRDLNEFNNTFASNSKELKETLALVTDSYKGQVEILDAIEKIKITKIAKANVEVYDKLQGCTEELEKLFDHLGQSEHYINSVVTLNNQLGSIEERTRVFEEVGNYFKDEIEYVKDRQGLMRQQMSSLDSVLQEAMSNLGDSVGNSLSRLTEVFQRQNQGVQALIEEQQNSLLESLAQQRLAINQKIAEIDDPFSSLKETFVEIGQHTSEGIERITSSFEQQNIAVSQMLASQREMMEKEMSVQREEILRKMENLPEQFSSLSQVANAIRQLSNVLTAQQNELAKQGELVGKLLSSGKETNDGVVHEPQKTWIDWLTVGGVCGSFLLLLAMLLVQLFGILI